MAAKRLRKLKLLPATGAIRTEIARVGIQTVTNLGKRVRWS